MDFSLEQLEAMLVNVSEDISLPTPYKHQIIRALQNMIAQFYLDDYLGNYGTIDKGKVPNIDHSKCDFSCHCRLRTPG